MKQLIKEYAKSGAFEVWRSWRDTMLAQGREVNEKFMELPIPERDMELDAQIAEDVVNDFLVWVESHYNLYLTQRAADGAQDRETFFIKHEGKEYKFRRDTSKELRQFLDDD